MLPDQGNYERPLVLKDGAWVPVTPLKGSRLYRVESWCRRHHLARIASLLAWYDELWLR